MSAVFDGICLLHIIQGPFYSMLQDTTNVFGALVRTNTITQSPDFGLASARQLLIKYPIAYRPVVAYDTVNMIPTQQMINYESYSLDAKKYFRSNYELKSNFVIAFGTGVHIIFVLQQVQVAIIHQSAQNSIL
ncbi:MAG: hypothetical protein EZS28_030381 [Streblomastix strix]|uniref:Uncharacterized protein n=1 Tax=Streblomastix strix TaxID=222440 RepID=A0A5J4UVH1_9EUKA|nr:MAG: hypothetical protein EZS28_030381 [Streblomastix strix]